MDKKKVMVIGDGVVPTGFSRVLHSIFSEFDNDEFDIHWLAVNYFGDPHTFPFKIYPARGAVGDVYGLSRVGSLALHIMPDVIFILNDIWIIDKYLDRIKEAYKDTTLPKIFIYFPVDAEDHKSHWYKNSDMVTKAYTYTEFGRGVVAKAAPEFNVDILPHGVSNETFHKLDMSKTDIRKQLFNGVDKLLAEDAFIILNGNRNQPRKRIDTTMRAFAEFAADKPENVLLYLHMGVIDAHLDILQLAANLGISDRLIVSTKQHGTQTVPDEKLNLIYNACDVGVNTSLGEGWGLVNTEHALTGAPQIVGNYSAMRDIFKTCGILVDPVMAFSQSDVSTTGYLLHPSSVAMAFESLYRDTELRQKLSELSIKHFSSDEFSWERIANKLKNDIREAIS